jgi:hypothetical protein
VVEEYVAALHVDEAEQALQHEVNINLFPNWTAQQQVRLVEIDGDVLHLSIGTPTKLGAANKTVSLPLA